MPPHGWNIVKAAKGRNLFALQQMGYHVRGAMLEKYHKLRPKSKTIRELKVALKLMWEDLPLEPMNKDIKTLQKDSEHVWVLVVDTLNSSCETIIKSVR